MPLLAGKARSALLLSLGGSLVRAGMSLIILNQFIGVYHLYGKMSSNWL